MVAEVTHIGRSNTIIGTQMEEAKLDLSALKIKGITLQHNLVMAARCVENSSIVNHILPSGNVFAAALCTTRDLQA